MSKEEHETIVSSVRSDELVNIYSSNPAHIRKIKSDDRFTVTREDIEDGKIVAVHATIPQDSYNVLGGIRRKRNLTPEQRQALSDRLKRTRGI